MNTDLTNRRALVCGASAGIGRACAVELASLGAEVALLARSADALEQLRAVLPADHAQTHRALPADLSDADALERIVIAHVDAVGPHHILVNNTGGPPEGQALEIRPEDLRAAVEAHLVSAHALVRALVPGMTEAGYGRIVNITSTSVKAPIPRLAISNIVRAGVAAWAKSLSMQLGPSGITVNNVLPGFTDTDRLGDLIDEWARQDNVSPQTFIERAEQTIPARRFGTPEEIAAAVAFLASPAGAYISGVNLPVDGGRLPTL